MTNLDFSTLNEKWRVFLGLSHADVKALGCIDISPSSQKEIYPDALSRFKAFGLTPPEDTRIVILGQDPYHGPGQADGLCFSVPDDCQAPPSLRNIFKELLDDTGALRSSTSLDDWATQGILLLNSSLSVFKSDPGSHMDFWKPFTDLVISKINEKNEGVVFVLWGAHAQKKQALIEKNKHFIIADPHPSPLSSYRGFFGSKPFSRINNYLVAAGKNPVTW
mgnify:CR=1 FL=1